MSSTPLHKSPDPDELLPWFVNHMRTLSEEEIVDNLATPCTTNLKDSCLLDEDEAAGQGSLHSATDTK